MYDSQRIVDRELEVNSCGCQVIDDKDYSVIRTRKDYTVMYLSQGKASVFADGELRTVMPVKLWCFCLEQGSNMCI